MLILKKKHCWWRNRWLKSTYLSKWKTYMDYLMRPKSSWCFSSYSVPGKLILKLKYISFFKSITMSNLMTTQILWTSMTNLVGYDNLYCNYWNIIYSSNIHIISFTVTSLYHTTYIEQLQMYYFPKFVTFFFFSKSTL